MANNSLIRKVPLLGNCDLTNFHSDIHNYEGFETDNSLFLNKRKINWWKREADGSEFSGLHALINGDYFDIYKGSNKLGHISRNYYKLESVSATEYRNYSLSQVTNPLPSNKNYKCFYKRGNISIEGNPFDYVIRECGNHTVVWDKQHKSLKCYNLDGTYTIEKPTYVWDMNGTRLLADYVDFFYAETAYDINIHSVKITIPQGYVYVCMKNGNAGAGLLLNPETGSFSPCEPILMNEEPASSYFVDNLNPLAHGALGHLYDLGRVSGFDINYSISVINGIIYVIFYAGWYTSLPAGKTFVISKQGTEIIREEIQNEGFDSKPVASSVTDFDTSEYPCKAMLRMSLQGTIRKSVEFNSTHTYQIFNYSKKYGKWAVNFVNNVAQNIAHDFKKLYEIKGDEEEGVVTDIDGYDDNYIFFHFAENYYRISIAKADNIHDVVKTFNGIYVLFNTTSYLNAIYLRNNTWFCSCDDWNDRLNWLQASQEYQLLESSSRLNDKWQIANNVESVSTQYYLLQRIFPVTCVRVTAFPDTATWDGSQYVFDANCNRVNTDGWDIGHSLAGYYEGTEFNSIPTAITPFFVDSNYTCPIYADQNGIARNQSYTVYFQKVLNISQAQNAVKQGMISAGGFLVSIDEGDIYTSPPSSFQQQETPCLLDTEYVVYESSVLAIKPDTQSSYQLMRNSQLGLWVFVYLTTTEAPVSAGDSVFVINGVEYVYKAESEQIQDYTGAWIANTNMLLYIGFTSTKAYFYSKFDKNVYAFKGDNSFEKVISLERFPLSYSASGQPNTLYMSSIDVLFLNLITAVLVLYDNQFILLDTGTVNSWELDYRTSCLNVNNVLYSLVKSTLEENNTQNFEISAIPIKFTTQLYGDPENETNMINDCLYLTIDNLHNLAKGTIKIKAEGLCNGKIVKGEERIMKLKNEDFNELSQVLIKFQPKIQEAKGLKFYIESDFEVAEMKIGTSQGAMNQTTKRI